MIAALRAAETKTERSGGAGRKGGWGEMNARPALAFAAAEFRILLLEMRRKKKRSCVCPTLPCAHNIFTP
jgi:hypothetical protein